MTADGQDLVGECDPKAAWAGLDSDPKSQLVDVRTRAEWSFVGVPDLAPLGREVILSEWRIFPDMRINPVFVDEVLGRFGDDIPTQIYFICRSGAFSWSQRPVDRYHSKISSRIPPWRNEQDPEGACEEAGVSKSWHERRPRRRDDGLADWGRAPSPARPVRG